MKTILKGLIYTTDEKFYKTLDKSFDGKVSIFKETNFLDALVVSVTISPDFILIDCESINSHEKILKKVINSENLKNLLVVLVSDKDLSGVIDEKRDDLIVLPKTNFKIDLNEIQILIQMKKIKQNRFYLKDIEVDKLISKRLEELSFNNKYIGTIYLKELIKIILYNDGELSFLNSKLYPMLSFRFQTKVENIERNIRNSIKNAFSEIGEEKFAAALGLNKFEKSCLANRSFIAIFIEKCKISLNDKNDKKNIG